MLPKKEDNKWSTKLPYSDGSAVINDGKKREASSCEIVNDRLLQDFFSVQHTRLNKDYEVA